MLPYCIETSLWSFYGLFVTNLSFFKVWRWARERSPFSIFCGKSASANSDHPCTEQLQKELREKNKQYTELQIEHDQLKADFEALKKKMEAMETKKSPVKSVIDDSDDEVEETKTTSKKHKIIKAIECDE